MKFFLRTVFLSILVSLLLLDTFAQTPSVQWVRELPNPTKSYTVNYLTNLTSYETKSTGFFALENDVALGYTTPILYKFGASGEITWQKSLSECSNVKTCAKYDVKATNDGGLLLLESWFGSITKYSQSGNTEWSIAMDRRLYSSLPTSVASNDNFFTVTDMLNKQVSCYTKTGKLIWGMTLDNTIVNLQATDDNGVIVLTPSSMLKLSSTGQIQWRNNAIGEQIKLITADYFCAKSTTSISMFSLINGNLVWSYPITGVNDYSVTADKYIAFVTNTKTVKLSINKVEVLSRSIGGNQLVATSDSAFVVRNGIQSISKFSKNNQITWSKTMTSTSNSALRINSSIDGGIFITGYHNYFSAYKNTSFIGKIAADSKPCDYDVSISQTVSTSKVCKIDTLKLNLSNYPLTLGNAELLTADFKIQWKKDNVNIAGANDISYTPTQGGSYTVTIQQAGACSVTSSATVLTVINPSAPVISANYNPVCSGATTTLTASGCDNGTVVWSSGSRGTTLTSTPVSSPSYYNAYCSVDYKIGTQTYSCASNTSANYAVTTTPNSLKSSISSLENNICSTGSINLSSAVTGGTTPYKYDWASSSQTSISQNSSFSVSEAGNYYLRIVDASGCQTTSNTLTITKSNPSVIISGNNEFCSGTNIPLSSTINSGTAPFKYSWTKDNNNTLLGTDPNLSISKGGTYNLTVTDAKNCSVTQSKVVNENLLPQLNIKGNSEFCTNGSTSLTAEVSSGTPNYTYSWSKDNNTLGINQSISISKVGTYNITVTDTKSCSVTQSKVVTENLLPQLNIKGNLEFCTNGSTSLIAEVSSGTPNYSSSWSKDNSVLKGETNPTLIVTSNGVYLLTVTDSKNCTATLSKPVIEKESPSIENLDKDYTLTGTNTISDLNYYVKGGITPYSYKWQTTPEISGNSSTLSKPILGPFVGKTLITLTVTDQKSCSASKSFSVNYTPCSLSVNLLGDDAFCKGNSTLLSTEVKNGILPYKYLWQNKNGNSVGTNSTLIINKLGDYFVSVTDTNGCQAISKTLSILEKGGDISAFISAIGNTTVYSPNTVTLNANTGLNYAYQWTKDSINIANAIQPSYVASTTGKYAVKISRDGCSLTSQPIFITISIPLATENTLEESSIHIGPNPTTTQLNIAVNLPESENVTIQVVDIKGQGIFEQKSSQKLSTHEITIDTSQWRDGVYFLKIQSSKKQTIRKIIKQ